MDGIFAEIRAAYGANLWVVALMGTLAIPDICAALDHGATTGVRYKQWFRDNMDSDYVSLRMPLRVVDGPIDTTTFETVDLASEFYKMRCSMLHEGRSASRVFERVVFADAHGKAIHRSFTAADYKFVMILDLPSFAEDVISAAAKWTKANAHREPVARRLDAIVQWRNGWGIQAMEDTGARWLC